MIQPEKDWLDVLSALAPVLISIGVAYVAFQQWRTAEKKRRQDLFDKRYKFFRRVWQIYERQVVQERSRASVKWVSFANDHTKQNGGKPWAYCLLCQPTRFSQARHWRDWWRGLRWGGRLDGNFED